MHLVCIRVRLKYFILLNHPRQLSVITYSSIYYSNLNNPIIREFHLVNL